MLRVALLAVLLLASAVPAAAEYPERPLTIVVAYPAGGMVDIVARPMAESMKKKFPKGVAILNRPGGGGSLGVAEVVQAKPDGYTVILAPNSTLVIHPQLNDLPYRTPDDYEPIMGTISFYTLLAVKADSPFKTIQDFVAAAKADPGKVRVGSPGEGTISHLTAERWAGAACFKFTHVPFSGWGETSPALLGGHIDAVVAQPAELKGQVEGKRMRVLAAFQPKRHPVFPDVPTAKEVGYDVANGVWFLLMAPKGTPAPVVSYLQAAAKEAVEDPKFVNAMADKGIDADYRPGSVLRSDLWREYKAHTDILRRIGMIKK